MNPNQIMSWAITAATIMGGVIAYFIMMESIRRKYKRETLNRVTKEPMIRMQVIEKDGTEHNSWGVVGSLTVKDQQTGEEYPIDNIQFIQAWYPEGGIFAGLGTGVQKGLFVRGKPESLVLRDYESPPTNVTNLMGILRNEKFLTIAAQIQDDIDGKLNKFKKNELSPPVIYGLLAVLFLGVGVAIYFVWLIIQKLTIFGV